MFKDEKMKHCSTNPIGNTAIYMNFHVNLYSVTETDHSSM